MAPTPHVLRFAQSEGMKIVRILVAGLAVAGLSANVSAQSRNCLTHAETTAMIGYALPDLLGGLREKCKAALPAGAFLTSRSGEVEARYRAQSDTLWPEAKSALAKMVGDDATLRKMPDTAVRPFLTAAFATAITDDIKPKDCPTADGVVEMLAPLPPQNLARLIGIILASEDKDSDPAGRSGFEVCG